MIKKGLIILIMGFLVQLIISCCNCADPVTYKNIYTELIIIPYDNSGFHSELATDTVYKNAFGLGIQVSFESKIYARQMVATCGFQFAKAFSCSCAEDEFIYPDPISHLKIYVTNQENGHRKEINDCFQMRGYNDENLSLEDFFEQRESWHDGFQLELIKFDSIPDQVIFSAEVFFESGKSFIGHTEVVNFY